MVIPKSAIAQTNSKQYCHYMKRLEGARASTGLCVDVSSGVII